MPDLPYLPMFVTDLLGDTMDLSAEEFGAYHLLLYALWRNRCRPIDADPTRLAGLCRVSVRRWKQKLAPRLLEFFDQDLLKADQKIQQKRLKAEWDKRSKKTEQQSEAGKRSAEARALKNNKTPSTDVATDEPPPLQRDCERNAEREHQRKPRNVATSLELKKERVLADRVFNTRARDPAPARDNPSASTQPPAISPDDVAALSERILEITGASYETHSNWHFLGSTVQGWLSKHSPETILSAVRKGMAKATEPPRSPKYFNPILNEIAALERGETLAQAGPVEPRKSALERVLENRPNFTKELLALRKNGGDVAAENRALEILGEA